MRFHERVQRVRENEHDAGAKQLEKSQKHGSKTQPEQGAQLDLRGLQRQQELQGNFQPKTLLVLGNQQAKVPRKETNQ